jgi:hypothetical protein
MLSQPLPTIKKFCLKSRNTKPTSAARDVFVAFAQLAQVEGLCAAEFHAAVDHFAVGGARKDLPDAATAAVSDTLK